MPKTEPEMIEGWTPEGLSAWGRALVKTGIEHLDLPMVRRGKQALEKVAAASPAPDGPPERAA